LTTAEFIYIFIFYHRNILSIILFSVYFINKKLIVLINSAVSKKSDNQLRC